MKIALTFLTLSVILLLSSLMWGMMTYTQLAHARADVQRLQGEVDEYRLAAIQGLAPQGAQIPVASVAPAPPTGTTPIQPAQPAQPAMTDAQLEAKLEAMMEEKFLVSCEQDSQKVSDLEAELRALSRGSDLQTAELETLRTEKERFDPTSITEQQNRIATLPALARVVGADKKSVGFGFVVIDAGRNKGIKPKTRFSLRRGHVIIAALEIDDEVGETECIANIVDGSVPTGIEIKDGDEVIDFVGS